MHIGEPLRTIIVEPPFTTARTFPSGARNQDFMWLVGIF